MDKYFEIIIGSFTGYWNYLLYEITHPGWENYFYWLLALSLLVFGLELLLPWRKNQAIIRDGFCLDTYYIFFNFFLFSLIGYNALSNVGVEIFNDFLSLFGIENTVELLLLEVGLMLPLPLTILKTTMFSLIQSWGKMEMKTIGYC